MKKRILCLWFPGWPIQRLVVDRPDLRASVIVVHAHQAGRGQRVVCCSAAASAAGIRVGMPLAETASFLTDLDTVHFAQYDPASDLRRLQELADACQRYSPVVGLESAQPPAALLLDIGGTASRWGGEQALLQVVGAAFQQQGYVTRMAVADTVGAAWALAHYGDLEPLATCKDPLAWEPLQGQASAKGVVGTGAVSPPEGESAGGLAELPVESLRLEPGMLETLHALGIMRVDELLALPRTGLAARFSPKLLLRIDQATGQVAEPIEVYRAPPPLVAEYSFEEPTRRLTALESATQMLLEQLMAQLEPRQQGVVQLSCECFLLQQAEPLSIQVGLFQPTAVAQHLWDLVQMQLANCRFPGPVQRLVLRVLSAATLEARQTSVWEDDLQNLSKLRLWIERLSSRLGPHAVASVRLNPEALPEKAFQYQVVPLTGAWHVRERKSRRSAVRSRKDVGTRFPRDSDSLKAELQHDSGSLNAELRQVRVKHHPAAGLRPLRCLPRPVRLTHVTLRSDGLLHSFAYQGETHRVTCGWGPERIETGWWRGPLIRRDYYRVEDSGGFRYWIFRDLQRDAWFLQGIFS